MTEITHMRRRGFPRLGWGWGAGAGARETEASLRGWGAKARETEASHPGRGDGGLPQPGLGHCGAGAVGAGLADTSCAHRAASTGRSSSPCPTAALKRIFQIHTSRMTPGRRRDPGRSDHG